MNATDVNATLDAIKILQDLNRWSETGSVAHAILIHAWLRLEHEVKNYFWEQANQLQGRFNKVVDIESEA